MTSPTSYAVPPRSRLPWWAKALITAVVVTALAFALFVAAVVVSFSGGLDDVLDVRNPSPDSGSVRTARAEAVPRVAELASDLADGAPLADSGIRVERDECETGQHNWKVDDDFDLRCTASTAVVLSGNDVAAVRDAVAARLADWDRADGYDADARWTRGGDPRTGEGREVTVALVEPGPAGLLPYQLGAYDGRGITKDGERYDPTGDPGWYVLVTVSEQYFYA
jgi:hypothetical protein